MTPATVDWAARLDTGAAVILGRELVPAERERFARYLELLRTWQRVHRLVGSVEPKWIVDHVFLDSLTFLGALPQDARTILDLGSGAGIPGIPMKIVSPDMRLTMVEARARRVSFLMAVTRELELGDVVVIGARAEGLLEERDRFDAVVARCAGPVTDVVALGTRFLRPGGTLVVSAGPGSEAPGAERVRVAGGTGAGRGLLRFRRETARQDRSV